MKLGAFGVQFAIEQCQPGGTKTRKMGSDCGSANSARNHGRGGADLSFSPSQGCATAMSRDYHFGECLTSVHCLHPGLGSDRPEAEYLRGEISCLEPTRLDTCTAAEHSFHASRDTGSASSILVLYPGLSIVFCTRVSSHEHEFTQWPPLVIYWPDATAHGFGGFTLQVI